MDYTRLICFIMRLIYIDSIVGLLLVDHGAGQFAVYSSIPHYSGMYNSGADTLRVASSAQYGTGWTMPCHVCLIDLLCKSSEMVINGRSMLSCLHRLQGRYGCISGHNHMLEREDEPFFACTRRATPRPQRKLLETEGHLLPSSSLTD